MSDSISRQAAIRWVKTECNPYGKPTLDFESGKKVIEHLEQMPSADRPQGEWIRNRYWSRGVGMGEEYGFFYKCSMCEYEVESGYTRCGFNYCPHCGSRMKGADDEL